MIVSRGPKPLPSVAFIGRGQEMAELRELLATERMLTLCGACGMGKSRIAERLGIVEERGRDPLDTLADALRSSRLLLVLDNCERLVDIVAKVSVRLLADCPGLRVLATSREPLHVTGECVRRIPALTVPPVGEVVARAQAYDSVRLFAVRAAAWRPEFRLTAANIPAVVRICRALDGMPPAIELALGPMPPAGPPGRPGAAGGHLGGRPEANQTGGLTPTSSGRSSPGSRPKADGSGPPGTGGD